MKKYWYCFLAALISVGSSVHASEGVEFKEKGSFGVMGAITEDMWKGGLVYQAESWEFSAIGHLGISDGDNIETHVITRVGLRHNLGASNYFAYGADVQFHPGRKVGGIDVSDAYQIGPYVALERYFAGTNLMISLWVNPFQFDHVTDASAGSKVVSNSRHFFQTGGFGIAYMF